MSSINYIKELKKVRLPKRIAAVGTAGLIVGAFAGAPAAPAAQNYAPQCDATAKFTLQGLKVAYNIVCTDYSDTSTVATAGDSNQGTWTAKSYAEGDYVKYSNNKWYRAAIAATSADEPTKPRTEDGELINVWTELSTDTAAAWSATSLAATATAGSFPSGYVVSKAISGITHYFKANADAVAADLPGTSSKWDDLGQYAAAWADGVYAKDAVVSKGGHYYKAATAAVAKGDPAPDAVGTAWTDLGAQANGTGLPYTGPQPGGSKVLTVKYPALVSGYSVIVLNNGVDGFDTEPAILKADKSGPAINQTQFCNGDHPGAGVSCSLQSAVNLYGQLNSDSSYTQLTGKTLAVKNSDNTYSDLKSTNLYGDNSLTGSPTKTSASTDFFNLGALGNTTNSGKLIMPALSGSNITGELEISDSPCTWGGSLQMVALTADPEGQMNTPISFEIPKSKYFRIVKLKDGSRETQEIPAGCTFNYSPTSPLVYSYDSSLKIVPLARPAKGSATRILAD